MTHVVGILLMLAACGDGNDAPALGEVLHVSAGSRFTCAAHESGAASCWGTNSFGQLGDGTMTDRATPVRVAGVDGVVDIATGTYFTCALRDAGSVLCWGSNQHGQLGSGEEGGVQPIAVEVVGLRDAVGLTAGGQHACAVRRSGDVACWGYNWSGQIGDGTTDSRSSPTPVSGVDDAVAVTAGAEHTCVLRETGEVSCWGRAGALGNGTGSGSTTPAGVVGLAGGQQVAAGDVNTCARDDAGLVWCWGPNDSGQLGLGCGATCGGTTAVRVTGVDGALETAVGSRFACAVIGSRGVACWGAQLDAGPGGPEIRFVSDAGDVLELAGGADHACALRPGELSCWGRNGAGQLGDGTMTDAGRPVIVRWPH